MTPNIKENPRNRKKTKKGRKRIYEGDIFQERFNTIERVFAWEDKFKRLLIRFERISRHHFSLKLLAYTMINLRTNSTILYLHINKIYFVSIKSFFESTSITNRDKNDEDNGEINVFP